MAKTAYKTVAFFEVCDENELPMLPEDWQAQLRDLRRRQASQGATSMRHEIDGVRHYAQVFTHNEEAHLVLARERDEPPSSLDESTGEILDEATNANRPWVEIAVLSFVKDTNIFGFVLGSMGSPRAGAFAHWVNEDGQLFGEPISVRPYAADNLVNLLQDGSSEARMVSTRLDASQLYSQNVVDESGLYSATQQMARQLDLGPEVDVEVILRIRGRSDGATVGTRRRLGDIGRSLINRSMRGGKVEIVDFERESETDRELVDLVKHRMATKERVSVLNDDGSQVRIPSAINAISRATSKLQIKAD